MLGVVQAIIINRFINKNHAVHEHLCRVGQRENNYLLTELRSPRWHPFQSQSQRIQVL